MERKALCSRKKSKKTKKTLPAALERVKNFPPVSEFYNVCVCGGFAWLVAGNAALCAERLVLLYRPSFHERLGLTRATVIVLVTAAHVRSSLFSKTQNGKIILQASFATLVTTAVVLGSFSMFIGGGKRLFSQRVSRGLSL